MISAFVRRLAAVSKNMSRVMFKFGMINVVKRGKTGNYVETKEDSPNRENWSKVVCYLSFTNMYIHIYIYSVGSRCIPLYT